MCNCDYKKGCFFCEMCVWVRCQSRITIEKKGLMPGMLLLEGRKSDEFSVKKVYGT